MADRMKLVVRPREAVGSREARRLRRQGLVPGVLYGGGKASQPFAVPERDLRGALTGEAGLHAILDVVVDGAKAAHPSVLKEFQQDPVRGTITHVDFHEVRLDRPIQVAVAVTLVGEARGTKEGGVLSPVTRDLNVEALPGNIPDHLEADVSDLEIGDSLRLSELTAPEGVTFLDDPDETVIATVAAPRRIEEIEEEIAEGEEAAEEAALEGEAEAQAASEGEPGTVEG